MSGLRVTVRAPSNIAWMKYMGKKDGSGNIPENPSVSMTLNRLCTLAEVELVLDANEPSRWIPEAPRLKPQDLIAHPYWRVPDLNPSGVQKVLSHLERAQKAAPEILEQFGLGVNQDFYQRAKLQVRTVNTFPEASGIASSASSFAALTLATVAGFSADLEKFQSEWKRNPGLRQALAKVSRQGSGSSCRSFEGPWVYWENEEAVALKSHALPELTHFVLLVKSEPKQVSSSEAHRRVKSSPLWEGRVERVVSRVQALNEAIRLGDLKQVSQLTWVEAWEMHSLFHTSLSPFTYWEPETLSLLKWFDQWMSQGETPIVTLDAGPNLHVSVESSSREIWLKRLQESFPKLSILEDSAGFGADLEGWMTL